MQSRLLAHGDFLNLSRFSPDLVYAQTFRLTSGVSANIIAPGIVQFMPPEIDDAGKFIVLSSGIHGNETAPIEICDNFVKQIFTGALVPVFPVLFVFGNLPAMAIAERFVEENMNRLFSGAHSQSDTAPNAERIRAKQLEEAVAAFFALSSPSSTRLHYDLHTAIKESKNEKFAVYPFLHDKPYSLEQIGFLQACGVNTILLSESPTTTFSYFSSRQFGAHAFTVELGKVRPFGQNDMCRFNDARNALLSLMCDRNVAYTVQKDTLELFRVNQVINRTTENFTLHFDASTPNFAGFSKGESLASDGEKAYLAEYDGEAIVFPNANVALGQRALLTVVPTKLEDLHV
ncbi:succinylglutamate desuccinylase [Aestuariibacter sp. A3R04]|uniref:succinylglutamate desuccinylase n=1 Tax=Aestuariibacter sp. A3R04 TaxID=2841571 RepID=UPI001C081D86|nr:succinylglutamate desuccinylase [Aestuariibacter sp. A3R04]MBU3022602.1 succinylglutamate desuccinylase [Aestuariibacter sp. A3R04]